MLFPVTSTQLMPPLGLPGLPGSGTVRLSPGWKGCPALPCAPTSAPTSPALREQLAHAAPWGFPLVKATWLLLFHLSLPITGVVLLKGSFYAVPSRFSLPISSYCMKPSSNYLFCMSPYSFLFSGWIHEWKGKKYFSLTMYCKRKGSLKTLSQLCPCAKGGKKNRVLFLKSLL